MADQQTPPVDETLTPEGVAERLGSAQVVDVRTDEEHAAGHIEGDRHIPIDRLTEATSDLDRAQPVIFYCRGGDRSATAAEAFRASGWEAYSLEGGLLAWAEQGHPLEPADGDVIEPSGLPPR